MVLNYTNTPLMHHNLTLLKMKPDKSGVHKSNIDADEKNKKEINKNGRTSV